MAQNTLYNKIFDLHKIRQLPTGEWQVAVGLHLIHEVTSPQAFSMLKERGLPVAHPELTFAVVDHVVPTEDLSRPLSDPLAEEMLQHLEVNCHEWNIKFFDLASPEQGIVHVVGPELGLTQPGKIICCGDSHTSTHGALGALAFGIGTTQVAMVLGTSSLALSELKVRRIEITGKLSKGVYAKDVILKIISVLGVKAGWGYAYEYGGSTVADMSMAERMTLCNMSIEGGAICGYVNPDQITVDYLRGRQYVPHDPKKFDQLSQWWLTLASNPKEVKYDDVVKFDVNNLEPMVTWGTNPGQGIGISERIPEPKTADDQDALDYMKFKPGEFLKNKPVGVVFIGSCTNGRLEDFVQAAQVVKGHHVAPGVRALVVPGSRLVKQEAERLGLDKIFRVAGFSWREPGCSMCIGMNGDLVPSGKYCASTSNRNFIGRQGSATGRTLLMSPAMVAAAAIHGKVVDISG